MTKPLIQIDGDLREATDDEIANLELMRSDSKKAIDDFEQRQKVRSEVIAKLGLSVDEASALLG